MSTTSIDLNTIRELVRADLAALDKAIQAHLNADIPFIEHLCQYIIGSGGKRLRPLITLLASKACGYQGDQHVDLACAIEFFHTATLLHDDVIDASHLRRGQKTAHDIWGSKASILVGDFLFTRAIQLLVSCNNNAIIALMADTANTISTGEIMQLLNCKNPDLDIKSYLQITFCKTAVLFATAAESAALLTAAPAAQKNALCCYGEHLGNAFQIVDDALDYCADEKALGKNIGDDFAEGKPTLPLIIAQQRGTAAEKAQIQHAIRQGKLDHLEPILAAIDRTQAIEHTYSYARKESQLAITALEPLPASDYKVALTDIAHFSVQRDF
jgi:octaprenyl-diphosphate synthase